ncbi:tyrosine-type recombinase/integrase [Sphingomonas sp. BIUV-7]|uniref:Tyrosine-type recombinase/integrase n=1 Tax=Sphingomonas natans TaxID=3063330 RepID=A0ABT8YC48_9SPHN|nr:integrase arm-type DNA-binding domain-containing protein [Sphingomonas sp. BIUV-7]MDO6415215.1 tyrosine-type recombinase/integrase [Sphingomonas sp. BIUV-7]
MRKGEHLYDALARAIRPKRRKREVADLASRHLVLVIYPSGHRSWIWRGQLDGKSVRKTLGEFPTYSVAEAREMAREISANRERGVNLIAIRRQASERQKAHERMSCDWAFGQYMKYEGRKRKTADEKWRIYRREISPVIGTKSVHDIRYEDLMPILREKARTAPIQSNRIRDLIRRWLNWSVREGRDLTKLEYNPARDLPKLGRVVARSRALSDYELTLLLRVLDASSSIYVEPYRFILQTGCRRGEAFGLRWDELFELDSHGHWRLPAERSKNAQELLLPLPQSLVDMLKDRRALRGNNPLVWPTAGPSGGELTGYSKALSGFERAMRELASRDGKTIPHWTAHDLRRTFITRMHGLKDAYHRTLSRDAIFSITNHKQDGIRATYNRYNYYAEKRDYLQIWSSFLEKLSLVDHRQLEFFQLLAA